MGEVMEVVCCFCGESLSFESAAKIYVSKDEYSPEQQIFSHWECLEDELHPSVPLYIKDLDDWKATLPNSVS